MAGEPPLAGALTGGTTMRDQEQHIGLPYWSLKAAETQCSNQAPPAPPIQGRLGRPAATMRSAETRD